MTKNTDNQNFIMNTSKEICVQVHECYFLYYLCDSLHIHIDFSLYMFDLSSDEAKDKLPVLYIYHLPVPML